VRSFASTSVPFKPETVQMPKLSINWDETDYSVLYSVQYSKSS
jgi:hypothetical protein